MLSEEFQHEQSEVLTFSSTNQARLSELFPLTMRVLLVTASSASVERVFSHGGLIMRPHRSRLGDTYNVEQFTILKMQYYWPLK